MTSSTGGTPDSFIVNIQGHGHYRISIKDLKTNAFAIAPKNAQERDELEKEIQRLFDQVPHADPIQKLTFDLSDEEILGRNHLYTPLDLQVAYKTTPTAPIKIDIANDPMKETATKTAEYFGKFFNDHDSRNSSPASSKPPSTRVTAEKVDEEDDATTVDSAEEGRSRHSPVASSEGEASVHSRRSRTPSGANVPPRPPYIHLPPRSRTGSRADGSAAAPPEGILPPIRNPSPTDTNDSDFGTPRSGFGSEQKIPSPPPEENASRARSRSQATPPPAKIPTPKPASAAAAPIHEPAPAAPLIKPLPLITERGESGVGCVLEAILSDRLSNQWIKDLCTHIVNDASQESARQTAAGRILYWIQNKYGKTEPLGLMESHRLALDLTRLTENPHEDYAPITDPHELLKALSKFGSLCKMPLPLQIENLGNPIPDDVTAVIFQQRTGLIGILYHIFIRSSTGWQLAYYNDSSKTKQIFIDPQTALEGNQELGKPYMFLRPTEQAAPSVPTQSKPAESIPSSAPAPIRTPTPSAKAESSAPILPPIYEAPPISIEIPKPAEPASSAPAPIKPPTSPVKTVRAAPPPILNPGDNSSMNSLLQTIMQDPILKGWLENVATAARVLTTDNPHSKEITGGMATLFSPSDRIRFIKMNKAEAGQIVLDWISHYWRADYTHSDVLAQNALNNKRLLDDLRMALIKLASLSKEDGLKPALYSTGVIDPAWLFERLSMLALTLESKIPKSRSPSFETERKKLQPPSLFQQKITHIQGKAIEGSLRLAHSKLEEAPGEGNVVWDEKLEPHSLIRLLDTAIPQPLQTLVQNSMNGSKQIEMSLRLSTQDQENVAEQAKRDGHPLEPGDYAVSFHATENRTAIAPPSLVIDVSKTKGTVCKDLSLTLQIAKDLTALSEGKRSTIPYDMVSMTLRKWDDKTKKSHFISILKQGEKWCLVNDAHPAKMMKPTDIVKILAGQPPRLDIGGSYNLADFTPQIVIFHQRPSSETTTSPEETSQETPISPPSPLHFSSRPPSVKRPRATPAPRPETPPAPSSAAPARPAPAAGPAKPVSLESWKQLVESEMKAMKTMAPKPTPTGIINPKCNCFLNSTMQMVMNSPRLRAMLKGIIRYYKDSGANKNPHLGVTKQALNLRGAWSEDEKNFIAMTKEKAAKDLEEWVNDYEKGVVYKDDAKFRNAFIKLISFSKARGLTDPPLLPTQQQEDADDTLNLLFTAADEIFAEGWSEFMDVTTQEEITREGDGIAFNEQEWEELKKTLQATYNIIDQNTFDTLWSALKGVVTSKKKEEWNTYKKTIQDYRDRANQRLFSGVSQTSFDTIWNAIQDAVRDGKSPTEWNALKKDLEQSCHIVDQNIFETAWNAVKSGKTLNTGEEAELQQKFSLALQERYEPLMPPNSLTPVLARHSMLKFKFPTTKRKNVPLQELAKTCFSVNKNELIQLDAGKPKKYQFSYTQKIKDLPKEINVTLSRFEATTNASGNQVIHKITEATPCDTLSLTLQGGDRAQEYDIDSITCHSGNTPNSGHYITFEKRGSQWWMCNGTRIEKTTEETVKKLLNGKTSEISSYGYPYVFHLTRKGPTPSSRPTSTASGNAAASERAQATQPKTKPSSQTAAPPAAKKSAAPIYHMPPKISKISDQSSGMTCVLQVLLHDPVSGGWLEHLCEETQKLFTGEAKATAARKIMEWITSYKGSKNTLSGAADALYKELSKLLGEDFGSHPAKLDPAIFFEKLCDFSEEVIKKASKVDKADKHAVFTNAERARLIPPFALDMVSRFLQMEDKGAPLFKPDQVDKKAPVAGQVMELVGREMHVQSHIDLPITSGQSLQKDLDEFFDPGIPQRKELKVRTEDGFEHQIFQVIPQKILTGETPPKEMLIKLTNPMNLDRLSAPCPKLSVGLPWDDNGGQKIIPYDITRIIFSQKKKDGTLFYQTVLKIKDATTGQWHWQLARHGGAPSPMSENQVHQALEGGSLGSPYLIFLKAH